MSDIQEIEMSLDHAKEIVAKGEMAMKLTSNREFKKLILEGYFKEEPARLTGLLAEPAMKAHEEDIIISLKAISALKLHLQNLVRMGEVAAQEIREYEEALDEARDLEEEIG